MKSPSQREAVISEIAAESEQKIVALKAELAVEERILAALRQKMGRASPAQQNGHVEEDDEENVEDKRSAGALPELICKALREAGGSMRAKDLTIAVERLGANTDSPRGLLPSILSALNRRDDLFEKVDRGVYKLKK